MPSSVERAFHGMIGRSARMQALFRRIERVAPLEQALVVVPGERRKLDVLEPSPRTVPMDLFRLEPKWL